MFGTRKCNITVRNKYHFIKRFARGKKYFPLLSSITTDYRKYFPFELPYKVTVEPTLCGIRNVKFEQNDYSVLFERPWFECTAYTFTSISEHKYSTLAGKQYLLQTKRYHNKGFYFNIACSGPETHPHDIVFPYKHLFEGITVEFKHIFIRLPTLRYIEVCEEMLKEIRTIFDEGKPFRFMDFLNIVLNNFGITVDEIEELEIPGILLYSQGTFHQAANYNGEYLTMMTQTEEKFLSPMCRYSSRVLSSKEYFISQNCLLDKTVSGKKHGEEFVVNIEPISQEEHDAMYADAKKHLSDFLKEVNFFNNNCSKQGSKSSGS